MTATARWYLVIWMQRFRNGQLCFHFSSLESENIDLWMIPHGSKVQNIYICTLNGEVVMGSVFLHLLIVETTGFRSFLRVSVAPQTSCDIKGNG